MGRRNKKELKLVFFLLLIFINSKSISQTKIIGSVKDVKNNFFSASIVLKDSTNNILEYTYSKDKGKYQFFTSEKGKFNIIFSSLGFKTKTYNLL